jgi:hypothetical protein
MKKIFKINHILIAIIIGLTVAIVSYAFTGPSLSPPSGNPAFWLLNGTKMYYSADNVGIGTSDPSHALDVTGTFHVTATSTFSGIIDAGSNRIINIATPTNTTDAANKAYVDATGISWAGYTSAQTGNLGGLKGANTICDSAYPGSHWASVDEIERLGSNYPWTDSVWVRGSINANGDFYRSVNVGYCYYNSTYNTKQYLPSYNNVYCTGWTNASQTFNFSASMGGGYNSCMGYARVYYRDDYYNGGIYATGYLYGIIMNSAGYLDYATCNNSYKIACVI